MKAFITLIFSVFFISNNLSSQETCTATVSGTQALRNLSWNCTGGATPPNASGTYNLNIVINGLSTGDVLVIDREYLFNGNFTLNASGSNPTVEIEAGAKLAVDGNIINDDNNVGYLVDGELRVSGSLTGKNNQVFTGSGEVFAYEINLGNNSSYGSPAPIVYVYDCNASPSTFCTSSNVNTEASTFDPLPIMLNKFDAQLEDGAVTLIWVTLAEINNQYFEILRGTQKNNLEVIGTVEGKGTTNKTNNYEFIDTTPLQGQSYYQLKQTDFDGKSTKSDIVKIINELTDEVDVKVYPNPVTAGENVYIKIPKVSDEELGVFMNDFMGQSHILDLTIIEMDNTTLIILEFDQAISKGYYQINLVIGGKLVTKKLLIQ